jgi:hypothetical protein
VAGPGRREGGRPREEEAHEGGSRSEALRRRLQEGVLGRWLSLEEYQGGGEGKPS